MKADKALKIAKKQKKKRELNFEKDMYKNILNDIKFNVKNGYTKIDGLYAFGDFEVIKRITEKIEKKGYKVDVTQTSSGTRLKIEWGEQ